MATNRSVCDIDADVAAVADVLIMQRNLNHTYRLRARNKQIRWFDKENYVLLAKVTLHSPAYSGVDYLRYTTLTLENCSHQIPLCK